MTVPLDLDGEWVAIDGPWGPVPALDPGLIWVCPFPKDAAVLVDRRGRVRRRVDLPAPGILRAELEDGLVVEDNQGNMSLVGLDGTGRPWHAVMVVGASDGVVMAAERRGTGLIGFNRAGNEVGRVDVEPGWRWLILGSASPTGRHYLGEVGEDVPFKEVLKGARPAHRLVIGDMHSGRVIPVDTAGHPTGLPIWDRTGERIFCRTSDDSLGTSRSTTRSYAERVTAASPLLRWST